MPVAEAVSKGSSSVAVCQPPLPPPPARRSRTLNYLEAGISPALYSTTPPPPLCWANHTETGSELPR